MNAEHSELLGRLEKFSPDSKNSIFPFSARLAKENDWRAAFTRRVIEEYKRFAFLAVAAGHPVSPSEPVDQAWHLHLTYTEDYWKKFCGEVLRKPLHHHPTKGGIHEREKFHDWYSKTLESYRNFFGEPPTDIWPSLEIKQATKEHFVRVDKASHWIIPKPDFKIRASTAVLLALLPLIAIGCGTMMLGTANPFDMRGPDFLLFYIVLAAICFGIAFLVRWKLRGPSEAAREDLSDLDAYSIAYLNGGRILTVNAAIANLVHAKAISPDVQNTNILRTGELPDNAAPLERTIHAAVTSLGGKSVSDIRERAKPFVELISNDLKQKGLVVADTQARAAILLSGLIALIAPLIGGIKICVGLSRGRPVGFLIILCVLSIIALIFVFGRRPLRTLRGDTLLKQLQNRHNNLRRLDRRIINPSSFDVALALGLFGMAVLEDTSMASLKKTLQPPTGTSGCGSGCGHGCGGGGGSSGCGSSCGGGCGGCGGGGH